MAAQIILALCEGPHDVAFIRRILKCDGFVSNEHLKISGFPQPMNKLMEQAVMKTEVQEINLQQARQNLLPLNTLQKDESFVFLYSVGGDGKRAFREDILTSLLLNIPAPGEITKDRLPEGTQLSLTYFFDADNKGVAPRLTEIRREIRTVISGMPTDALPSNGSFGVFEGLKIGAFIFTGDDNNTGKLEDILAPLMQVGNEKIFTNTEAYLDSNHDPARVYPLKITIDPETGRISEGRSSRSADTEFDRRKSIIGIAGQLQRSGKANTVYINDTDYINLEKISSNAKCQEIVRFFSNFMNDGIA